MTNTNNNSFSHNKFYKRFATNHAFYLQNHDVPRTFLNNFFDIILLDDTQTLIDYNISIFEYFDILNPILKFVENLITEEPEHPYYEELKEYYIFLTTKLF